MAVVVTVFYAPRVLVKQCAHCELSPELGVLPLIHDLLVHLSRFRISLNCGGILWSGQNHVGAVGCWNMICYGGFVYVVHIPH